MTREEAVKRLEAMIYNVAIVRGIVPDKYDIKALRMAIEALKAQEWIPCSERLPSEKEWTDSYIRNKKASEFFVMIKGADRPTTLYLSRDYYWFDENRDFYEVVAWMPLPEPYKAESEEQEDEE